MEKKINIIMEEIIIEENSRNFKKFLKIRELKNVFFSPTVESQDREEK